MSSSNSSFSAISWSFMDKLFKRGIQFFVSLFLARLLTPSDFGVVAMATIFVSWSEVFKDFGLGQALIQKQNATEEQISTVFYINIIMGVLIAIILTAIAPLAAKFYSNEMVGWCVRASALTFVITSFNVVQNSLLIKNLNYKIGTLASAYASSLSGLAGIICAYKGMGVWSLLVQSILSCIITTCIIWVKSNWRPMLLFNFKTTYPLFKKGIGYMGKGFTDNVFSSLDSMVIGKIFSTSALGLYNRGRGLYDMVNSTIVLPITRPLFPILARIQHDAVELKRYYIKVLNMLNWCLIFCAGEFLLCSDEIIFILYGEKWLESAKYLFWLSILFPFFANSCMASATLRSQGRVRLLLMIGIIERVIFSLSLFSLLIDLDTYVYIFVSVNVLLRIVESIYYVKALGISFIEQNREMIKGIIIITIPIIFFHFIRFDNYYISALVKSVVLIGFYMTMSYLLNQKGMFDIYKSIIKRKNL